MLDIFQYMKIIVFHLRYVRLQFKWPTHDNNRQIFYSFITHARYNIHIVTILSWLIGMLVIDTFQFCTINTAKYQLHVECCVYVRYLSTTSYVFFSNIFSERFMYVTILCYFNETNYIDLNWWNAPLPPI